MRQHFAEFHFDELEELGVVDEVDLVQEHDERRHTDLTSQQNVLAGLRHRAVCGRHDQDRAVHLGGAGDHVLDEVRVARAVDVGIVTCGRFVLDVRDGDRHGLRFVANGTALGDIGIRLRLGQTLCRLHGEQGAGGGRLAVINVTDGADVDVRFGPLKYSLGHCLPCSLRMISIVVKNVETTNSNYEPSQTNSRPKRTSHSIPTRAADGSRTRDLVLTKDALYQLSYSSRCSILGHKQQSKPNPNNSRKPKQLSQTQTTLANSNNLHRTQTSLLFICHQSG